MEERKDKTEKASLFSPLSHMCYLHVSCFPLETFVTQLTKNGILGICLSLYYLHDLGQLIPLYRPTCPHLQNEYI